MTDLTCPGCGGSDLMQVGLGRKRRCRECGRVWIATNLPDVPTVHRQHSGGRGPKGRSSRAASGVDGLEHLKELALAPQVRQALQRYLDVALANHRVDEADAWTLRALPSTKARKHRRRLFTVNVSNMEVLVAHFDPISGQESGGFILLKKSGAGRAIKGAIGKRDVYPAPYVTAGGEAVVTTFEDLDDLQVMLANPAVQEAARGLCDQLRSTAQVPSLQRQWHVPQFVDWVVGRGSSAQS